MVKIYTKDGKEEKFDSKDVEDNLKAAGLPERVAKEVAERVEDRVEDGWSEAKVNEETDVELKRLKEDIDRAYTSFKGQTSMGNYSTNDTRMRMEEHTVDRPREESRVELRNPDA